MKKAQGAQFNWIFVIVAGAIILGFFVTFTVKFIDIQQKKADFTVAKNIETNIQTLKTSSTDLYCDTSASPSCLSMGEKTYIEFYFQDGANKIIINKNVDHELNGETVYAPNLVFSKNLDFWVKPWSFPFHLSNFVFVSDPEKKFYLVFDQTTEDFVNLLDIPVIFSLQKIPVSQLSSIVPKSRVVFIISSEPPSNVISSLKSKKVILSYVNINTHKIKYYDNDEKDLDYLGDSQLLASIFSESTSNYVCNFDLNKKELNQVAKIYQQKSKLLSQFSQSQSCFYPQIHNTLKEFSENPTYELSEQLTKQNEDLISSGCKEIF